MTAKGVTRFQEKKTKNTIAPNCALGKNKGWRSPMDSVTKVFVGNGASCHPGMA